MPSRILPPSQNNPFYNKHLRASRFRAVDAPWNNVVGGG